MSKTENSRQPSAGTTGNSAASVENQQLPPEATGISEAVALSQALSPQRINLNLKAFDGDGILRALVALVIDSKDQHWSETLFQALKAREDLCPTCVNEGVAIPHARNAIVGLVERPVLAYGRHRAGIAFGALDGKPVHHFFLVCAPNVRDHLQLLARLLRLLRRPGFRAKLASAKLPNDVMTLVRDAETLIEQRR